MTLFEVFSGLGQWGRNLQKVSPPTPLLPTRSACAAAGRRNAASRRGRPSSVAIASSLAGLRRVYNRAAGSVRHRLAIGSGAPGAGLRPFTKVKSTKPRKAYRSRAIASVTTNYSVPLVSKLYRDLSFGIRFAQLLGFKTHRFAEGSRLSQGAPHLSSVWGGWSGDRAQCGSMVASLRAVYDEACCWRAHKTK